MEFCNCHIEFSILFLMKNSNKNQVISSTELTKRSRFQPSSGQLALQKFSNDLCNLQNKTAKKKSRQGQSSRRNRMKKLQNYIQEIKRLLIKDSSTPASNCLPIYYYPHLNQSPLNSLNLPQIKTKSCRESCQKYVEETQSMAWPSKDQSTTESTRLNSLQVTKRKKYKSSNRFKICAIAVFFCLLFPKFSKRFQQIRSKWFKDRYKSPFCLKHLAKSMSRKLTEIDLNRIYEVSRVKSYQTTKYPIINFIKLFLAQLSSVLTNKLTLKYHHELLGVGALNGHFYLDYDDNYMYYPEEIPFLKSNRKAGGDQLVITKHSEVLLIFIRTMVKIVLFNYLWEMSNQEDGDKNQYADTVKACAIYLHSVCLDIYKIGLKSLLAEQGQNQFVDSQQNQLQQTLRTRFTNTTINLLATKSIFYSKNLISLPSAPSAQNEPFCFMENMPGFKEISHQVSNSKILNDFRQEATDDIIDMIISIRQYLYEEERNVYGYIWGLTTEEKGLIRDQNTSNSRNSYGDDDQSAKRSLNNGVHRRYRSQNDEQIKNQSIRPPKSILKTTIFGKNKILLEARSKDRNESKIQKTSRTKTFQTPSLRISENTTMSRYERTDKEFKTRNK